MAELFITIGWLGYAACFFWLGLILVDLVLNLIPSLQSQPGWAVAFINRLALPPVNMMRRLLPTVYRDIDFSPWITLLGLIILKTFVFRAVIYWGMLHQ